MRKKLKKLLALGITALAVLAFTACGEATSTASDTNETASATTEDSVAPGQGATKLGVIMVGTRDDYGYNQAIYNCCVEAAENLGIEVLIKESVPEDSSAQAVMEQLVAEGCKLIYATSYGHREYAEEVALAHPDVAFWCSNAIGQDLPNVAVLSTNLWDSAYVNGICAGLMTKTNEIGYIGSFQIATVLNSMNAFALGVQAVNPDASVHAVFTGSWDDVGLQTNAVNAMASQNIDIIAQFQDYTKTIIETCEANNIMCVGYHVDTMDLAPNTFIIGAIDAFEKQEETFKAAIDGNFKAEIVRGGYQEGMCKNTACNSNIVPDDVAEKVQETVEALMSGELVVYKGQILGQDGTVKVEEGQTLTETEIDGMDYFVKGVVGMDL